MGFSLTNALFFMNLTRSANFNVLSVSPYESADGLTAAIIKVFELPPKLSFKMWVSFELR